MPSELKKHCELKVDYEVEGAVDGNIGDRKTLADARHFDPPLYVQARINEQTESFVRDEEVKTSLKLCPKVEPDCQWAIAKSGNN